MRTSAPKADASAIPPPRREDEDSDRGGVGEASYVSVVKAAGLLGFSTDTIYKMLHTGIFKSAIRTSERGRWRIAQSEIDFILDPPTPEPSPAPPPATGYLGPRRDIGTTVYRYFDADGDLLYVGVTAARTLRMLQHAREKAWWHEVVSVTLEHFPNRDEAEIAEFAAIEAENPRYNIAGRPPVAAGSPD